MGKEINLKDVMNAGGHVANAAASAVPNAPGVQLVQEIRAAIGDATGAFKAAKEAINAKQALKGSTNKETLVVESEKAKRLEPARPPELRPLILVEEVINVLEKIKDTEEGGKIIGDYTVRELFEKIKNNKPSAVALVTQFYHTNYEKILRLQ